MRKLSPKYSREVKPRLRWRQLLEGMEEILGPTLAALTVKAVPAEMDPVRRGEVAEVQARAHPEAEEVLEEKVEDLPLEEKVEDLPLEATAHLHVDPRGHRALQVPPGHRAEVGEVTQARASIRPLLSKLSDLPSWNGDHETAVKYFWDVSQKAALGGTIPELPGQWLGMRLEEGSPVQVWYTGLPGSQQASMRCHYMHYLYAIKEHYLGRNWQRRMNSEYERQRFRQ
jgi:hypothetical protein